MEWEHYRSTVYATLKPRWIQDHPQEIGVRSWEYLFEGGKQIRPRLFCALWAFHTDAPVPAELAFAIECIHVSSLVLDDHPCMDDSSERRGRPTLHKQLGSRKALLLAHDVLKLGYDVWIQYAPAHVPSKVWANLFHHTIRRMVWGQYHDLNHTEHLLPLAREKTGSLFALISESIAYLLELHPHVWRKWGEDVGILFQWKDDWLDREEDEVHGERNAFNETLSHATDLYRHTWNSVCCLMGPSWFQRPFGQFMIQYFTTQSPYTSSVSLTEKCMISQLSELYPVVYYSSPQTLPPCPKPTVNKKIVHVAYQLYCSKVGHTLFPREYDPVSYDMSLSMFQPLPRELWEMEEDTWETHPVLQGYLEDYPLLRILLEDG